MKPETTILLILLFLHLAYSQINWTTCPRIPLKRSTHFDDNNKTLIQAIIEKVNQPHKLEIHPHLLNQNLIESSLKRATSRTQQCAILKVPLDWENGTSETTEIFVTRYISSPPSKKRIWLIAGGPGESSTNVFASNDIAIKLYGNADADFYISDLRGVGYNNRVNCETVPRLMDPDTTFIRCLNQITPAGISKSLTYYTTTNNARDLKHIMDLTTEQYNETILYGASYGTYLAHRFDQLFPNFASGIVLDGVLVGPKSNLMDWTFNSQQVFNLYMSLCDADKLCSSKLGGKALSIAQNLIKKIERGYCAKVVTSLGGLNNVRFLLRQILMLRPTFGSLSTAVVYRLDRCNNDLGDEDFLIGLFGPNGDLDLQFILLSRAEIDMATMNELILFHMRGSELAREPVPSVSSLRNELSLSELGSGPVTQELSLILYSLRNNLNSTWPFYTPDQYKTEVSNSSTFYLLLTGQLDLNTPQFIAMDVSSRLKNNRHVVFNSSGHVPGLSTVCGGQVLLSYFVNGKNNIDTSCAARLPAYDFSGSDIKKLLTSIPPETDIYEDNPFSNNTLYVGLGVGLGLLLFLVGVIVIVLLVSKRSASSDDYQASPE